MDKIRLKRFIAISIAASFGHFLLLVFFFTFYHSSPTVTIQEINGAIWTVLMHPLEFLFDSAIESYLPSGYAMVPLVVLNSLLWGFALTSIIYFLKKPKQNHQDQSADL